ncbi:palmitoyltransferase ZDHHC20-A-like [Dermacentor variabilis]|uniref:palmitoyltransferase ZDHHC20-A-like n=1 Tax=Dermacentor variabilis TaxID=34621 RepID=UPI003F5CB6B5
MLPSVERPATPVEDGTCARRESFAKPNRLFAWLPVLLVSALLSWGYYAYVLVFCCVVIAQESIAKAVFFGIVFHLLLFLCVWSYAKTTATAIPDVPPAYLLSVGEQQALANCHNERTRRGLLEMLAADRGVFTLGPDGCARYCAPCQLLKPDRCHHCSTCRRCIMKMDHHCPWFNNCVCFSTYKFFLLTLAYVVALCIYTVTTLAAHLVEWGSDPSPLKPYGLHVGFIVLVGSALAIGLGSFLGMHLSMVSRNETTLESMRSIMFLEHGDSFDLGSRYRNFVEVFGLRWSLWLIPVFTSLGDGVRFPTRLHPTRGRVESRPSSFVPTYSAATYSTRSSSLDPGAAVVDIVR